MQLSIQLPQHSYPIVIERGALDRIGHMVDLNRPILLVYDTGIPRKWVDQVDQALNNPVHFCFEQGEGSKTFSTLQQVLEALCQANFHRDGQVVALGGGVVGDLAGFAAACYMRGIDFYNIPTTVLSQVDSSVGGKTAVDLGSIKNIVGAFWQPRGVIIDPDVLSTLDQRQAAAGLAEALKMGLLFDEKLVEAFEQETLDLEAIIARSIELKGMVVMQDEKEAGLRKALNFGHTIGHAIEGSRDDFAWLHGECVAAGMLYFLEDDALRKRVLAIEKRLNLPEIRDFDHEKASALLRHDKKGQGQTISCVLVDAPGSFHFEALTPKQIDQRLERNVYA